MALRVTARRAQRLGTTAPIQRSAPGNRACADKPGAGVASAARCNTKCAVRLTVPAAITVWNWVRVFSLCTVVFGSDGPWPMPAAAVPGRSCSDSQTLAALGAACVDDCASAACLHANEKTMRASTANFGRLVSTFHIGSCGESRLRIRPWRRSVQKQRCKQHRYSTLAPRRTRSP